MPSIKFDAVVETSKALAGLNAIQSAIHQTSEQVRQDGDSIDSVVNKIKEGATAIAGSWTAGQLVNKIMQVRGQFQQLEIAFGTMLGSEEKANDLMTQLIHTAAITPFDLQGVANGAKQLLAYGTSADEVNDVLTHLGDIAAGLSLPLNDLVYLYGTTMTQGRMFTMDLRQFMGRGIPLATELAKQFGVTEDKVAELVSAGKVGAAEFKQAIMAMSSEGGKFGGLMEAQSKSITGQIANIEDAVDVMFNNIGKSSEGVINSALGIVGSLVENYERVGKNLLAIAASYGTYKAAVVAVNVIQGVHNTLMEESAVQMALAKAQGIALSEVEAVAAAKTALHTAALNQLKVAMNAVKAASPYLLIAAAVATLALTWANAKSMQEKVNEAYDKYNEEKDKAIEKEKEHQTEMENLISVAGDESLSTDTRRLALVKLEQQYPAIFAKYKTEADELKHILDIKKEIAAMDGQTSLSNPKNELTSVNKRIKELEAKAKTKYTYQEATRPGVTETKTRGGLSIGEEVELQALKKRQAELNKTISKNSADAYMSNLSGISNKQLSQEIRDRQQLLAQLKLMNPSKGKTKKGQITRGGAKGTYTESELQGQLQAFQREQNDRKTATTTSNLKSQRKKELDAARKALADFDKSPKTMKTSDIESQRAKLQSAVDEAEKAYKALGGSTSTKKNSTKNTADKRKAAEEALSEQLLSLERENAENELAIQEESTEQKLKQIDEDYQKRIDEINKQEKKFKANNKKAGKSEALTSEQQTAIDDAKRIAKETRDKQTEDVTKEQKESEFSSRISYQKSFGTYDEKRTALKEEADDKIKKINGNKSLTDTDKSYQVQSVNKELEKSLSDLDFEQLKKEINWDFIFGDLENTAPEAVAAVREQLQKFAETAKDLTPDQIKTVSDALQKMQDRMDLSNPIKTIKTARAEYANAKKEYDKYAKAYEKAQENGDTKGMTEASKGMVTSSQQMAAAQNKEKKSFNEVMDIVNQYADALDKVGDTVGGTAGDLIKLAASAISCGISMADGIKKFQDATSAMERSIAILAIIEAALQAIQVIMNVFGSTADETLTDYVETMKLYIDLLKDSIDDLNDSMTDAKNSMKETIAYYDELVKTEKESATAIKAQSQTWLNSGASGGIMGIGSKASEGAKIKEQLKKDLKSGNAEVNKFYKEGYNSLNEYYKTATGKYAKSVDDFGRMTWIWDLSDEEIIKLSKDTKALSMLGDTLSEAITKYADYIEAAKEDELDLAESLLSVSWDDFYDDFVDLVKDMDNTSADFANNFAEYMRNALVKNMVAEKYRAQLENLYNEAVEDAKNGNLEDKLSYFKRAYADLAQSMQDEVETIDQITGYTDSSSQTATSGGFESMGQDTADELNGRFTALQIAGESVASNMTNTIEQMQSIVNLGISTNGAVLDIRNMMVMTNSYLEDVVKYSKLSYTDFGTKLDAVYTRLKEI